jgi:hypothetical protein
LRQKVRITPVPLVVELVDRSTQEPSPELHRRIEPRRRIVRRRRRFPGARAALDSFPVARATPPCLLCTKTSPPPSSIPCHVPPLAAGQALA